MTTQKINYGLAPDDGTGDKLRDAFRKTDDNFTDLDTRKANAQDVVDALAFKADTATVDAQLALKADATHVVTELAKKANLESPALTGTPTAPTAAPATNTDQVATTAFVQAATGSKVDKVAGKQLSTEDYTSDEKTKLGGIASGATANSTDANLRDRSTHTGTQPASTITGLGTAATKDVQITPDDAIPGRLLAVGAFGIGGLNRLVSYDASSLSYIPSGWSQFYLISPVGVPNSEYGYLTTYNAESGYLHQKFVGVFSGNTYKRTVVNWVIGPWMLETNQTNSAETIANGGIIESVSNANGTYTKFADGTLICIGNVTTPAAAMSTGINATWTLPTAFANATYALQHSTHTVISGGSIVSSGDIVANGVVVYKGTDHCILNVYAYKFATDPVTFSLTAIGRWK